jgi:uncharacterized repeat protein (TIGR01451 family)
MPRVDLVTPTKRPILAISLGVSLTVFVAVLAAVLFSGASADAASYTLTGSAPPFDWTNTAIWTSSSAPNTYPGQNNTNDDATLGRGGFTVTVTSGIPFPVRINVTQNGLSINGGGNLQIQGTSAVTSSGTFTLNNGTLANTGTLALGSGFTFAGGTLTGNGTTQVNAGGSFSFTGTAGAMTVDGGQIIDNVNSMSVGSANIVTLNAATIINEAGHQLNMLNSTIAVGGAPVINNFGTISASATNRVDATLNNSGTISLTAIGDNIALNGGGTHTGNFVFGLPSNTFFFSSGATPHVFNPGAAFSGPAGNVNIQGGIFAVGTTLSLPGNLNNAGILKFGPGATTQGLGVAGNFTQSATGALDVKLNGTTAVSQYDQVTVTGSATLGGTLNASLGYAPADNDTWSIITDVAGSAGTDFGTKSLPPYARGMVEEVPSPPAGTAVNLVAVPQADVAVAKSGPASVNDKQNATYTINVSNLGPDIADVTMTDTFSGPASFVSVSPPANCSATGPVTVTCTFLAMPVGTQFVTLVLQATGVGTITNNASASSPLQDPNPSNNTATPVTTAVNPVADLMINSVTGAPNPVNAGQSDTFSIIVGNGGPDAAASVVVNIGISGGGTITGASWPGFACTFTSSTAQCTAASLPVGPSTITVNTTAPNQAGMLTIGANIGSSTFDPNSGNNSGSGSVIVNALADIAVSKNGPSTASPGATITYTIDVKNFGPSDATGVVLNDPTPARLTFLSATGACTSFPCTIGLMPAGQISSVQATYKVQPGPPTATTNTATQSSSTTDPNTGNDSASFTTAIGCPSAPTSPSPADGAFDVATSGSLTWNDAGAVSYNVYLGRLGNGCSQAIGNTAGTSMPYALQQGTQYEWRVESVSPGCPAASTPCMKFTTINNCPTTPPTLVAPTNGSTVSSPVTFTWTAVGAVNYRVFASVGGATPTEVGATTGTSLTANIGDGAVTWYVVAEFPSPCAGVQSATGTFNTCTGIAPIPSLVSEVFTNQTYTLLWKAITGAPRYEVDEALDKFFTQGRSTQTVTTTSVSFQHTVAVPTAFFYRVRAFIPCSNSFGPYSETMRIVLALVPSPTAPNPNINVPAGSNRVVVQIVHIAGFPDGTFPFIATVDKPWLQVTPASGLLPPEGIDLTVTADPTTLPNGTQTGTVIVTLTSSFGSIRSNGVTTVSVPVSITLVTPVSPITKTLPPANTLIIPSAGHLDGINSRWQSDIRVANVSTQSARFQLTLTPDDLAKGVKQTVITANAGATIALDDIVRNWYGIGSLGEQANGILEIRPLDAVNAVASSRTYNLTSNGTLGQFIRAVPFGKFIGKVTDPNALAPVLGLQQIAQSPDYRTNFGVVEGSGSPVSLLVSVFNAAGAKLLDLPLDLKANEQRQLNGFLTQNKISLNDGRIEVKATSGDGKVTAYASVIDNRTGDPLLVPAVQLGQATATDYVLPGVADINNAFASWRTDMDAFNSGSTPLQATLTFYRQDGGPPKTATVTLNPGELKRLDNVLQSTFGTTNAGGAVHVTTAVPSSLVVTGRTYDQTPVGTVGQFIEAVTAADAVGKLDRALQILQAEDSVRYRTNVGIAEVTGKPATVEVSVVLPDSKISPKTTIQLPANGFFQANVIHGLGLSNVYNVRVAVKVINGDGKITAYGSVVDMKTQDPTFVPAQIDQQ